MTTFTQAITAAVLCAVPLATACGGGDDGSGALGSGHASPVAQYFDARDSLTEDFCTCSCQLQYGRECTSAIIESCIRDSNPDSQSRRTCVASVYAQTAIESAPYFECLTTDLVRRDTCMVDACMRGLSIEDARKSGCDYSDQLGPGDCPILRALDDRYDGCGLSTDVPINAYTACSYDCGDGEKIQFRDICDGVFNCRNEVDELVCTQMTSCGGNAGSVLFSKRCDGVEDCSNGGDEDGCFCPR